MTERAPKLSLDTAARMAYEQGILSKDFYALDHDQRDMLRWLLKETRYRQPSGGRAAGHSPVYDLWLALGRSAERQFKAMRRESSRDAPRSRRTEQYLDHFYEARAARPNSAAYQRETADANRVWRAMTERERQDALRYMRRETS